MIKALLAWLTAIALAAMPVAALATTPCPMIAASSAVAAMDHGTGAPMQMDCDHKPIKSCSDMCAAMTGVAVDLPTALFVPGPVPIITPAFLMPTAALVGNPPAGLDRPPRTDA